MRGGVFLGMKGFYKRRGVKNKSKIFPEFIAKNFRNDITSWDISYYCSISNENEKSI